MRDKKMSDVTKKTIKLYDDAPYSTQFAAAVLDTSVRKDGCLDVILDRTLFFPEEGGQTPDRGELGGFPVIDVQIRGDIITHTLKIPSDSAAPAQGERIEGTIDWEHRFSNMQNHTGEHIISGLIHNIYGFDNIGFHLSDNTCTLDQNGQLDDAQIAQIEQKANEAVWRNLPVTAEYPAPELLETLAYRSKIDLTDGVRIVTIPGVDVCACCAPHVAFTGEIGLIKITHVLRYNGGMRLTIVCGARALAEMQEKQTQVEICSRLMNSEQNKIADAVQRLLDEASQRKYELTGLEMRIADLLFEQVSGEDKNAWIFEEKLSTITQRNLCNRLCASRSGTCGVFVGNDEKGYSYIIGASTAGGDAREANTLLRTELSARGGGKPEMVQGSVKASADRIREVLSGAML